MTTVPEYAAILWQKQQVVAKRMGVDLSRADKPTRVVNYSLLVVASLLGKVLVDKGIVTNAELLAGLNGVEDAFDDFPIEPGG